MSRHLLPPALFAALLAALAPATTVAAPPPIYLVVDFVPKQAPVAGKAGNRRIVTVRAFDDGDAGACARAQRRIAGASRCVRDLPAEFAPLLQDGGLAGAYVLKFTTPDTPGAAYRAMFDMATTDAQQVCRNLVDYQQRFGELPPRTRIRCWVPRG
jgi:hypothetical protein